MRCPICTNERIEHHIEASILTRECTNYIFRKYHCSVFNKSFHTHEYLQDTRNEPVLKARLEAMRTTVSIANYHLERVKETLHQLELSL